MTLTMPETAPPTFIQPTNGQQAQLYPPCKSWCYVHAPEHCEGLCCTETRHMTMARYGRQPVTLWTHMTDSPKSGAPLEPTVMLSTPDHPAAFDIQGMEMTASEARRLAAQLLELADIAERG
jgi:hypothetical protein